MKSFIIPTLKGIFIAVILAAGFSYAFAFVGPTSQDDIPAPTNTGGVYQIKKGGIMAKFFIATAGSVTRSGNAPAGLIMAKEMIKAYDGLFTDQMYLAAPGAVLKIGDTQTLLPTVLPQADDMQLFTDETALTIDLVGRGDSSTGRNAMELLSGSSCLDNVATVTNTAAIQFWDTTHDRNADVIARQVRLSGGSPTANSVLVSTNGDGDATWATLRVVNGQISLTENEASPVTNGQSCGT